jgi:hypothetical protein
MNREENMTIDERYKYLRRIQKRYREADRAEKRRMLEEAIEVTELKRKTLIRLLGGEIKREPRQRQRGRTYGPDVQRAIAVIHKSLDRVCAERLQPNLVWMAEHLAVHGELEVNAQLLSQLGAISIPTVRRVLKRQQQDRPQLPHKGPSEANQAAKRVPIGKVAWDEQRPGFFEADLVYHSGPTASGLYAHSLQMIDIATGWSERVAVLGRSHRVMKDGFRRILTRLPFPVLHIHTDNGSEFVNDALLSFWEERSEPISLSRGRPYHKNDQPFVEQKNATLVRAYLGHDRFDTAIHVQFMNILYNKMWLFYNFFQPVLRLAEKEVVTDKAGRQRTRRKYDRAQTPFDRLCKTGVLSEEQRQQLEALRQRTNPRKLIEEIHSLIGQILDLPGADLGTPQDIFQTLLSEAEEERLRWAGGYVDKSPPSSDLPTYPQPLLRLSAEQNGKNKSTNSLTLKKPG